MYNNDKKLISSIYAGKDLEADLKEFVARAHATDFAYGCHRFALNYATLSEMFSDVSFSDDPYVMECVLVVNKLVSKYLVKDATELSENDKEAILKARRKVTKKMKVLTTYTDAFETYEYVLNRKEFNFDENLTDELADVFENTDKDTYAQTVCAYIFSDTDTSVVTAKLHQVMAQLPVRMTKAKFADMISDAISLYDGKPMADLDNYCNTLAETALIKLPEGFDTEYTELFDALETLKAGDYAHLDFENYRILANVLGKATDYIVHAVSDYMLLIEIINDLYVMVTHLSSKDVAVNVESSLKIIENSNKVFHGETSPEDAYEFFMDMMGLQEEEGEHRLVFEGACYDILQSKSEDVNALGFKADFDLMEMASKLYSGSSFVDIENVEIFMDTPADGAYVANASEELNGKLGEMFASNPTAVNRAIMAKLMPMLPMFFTDQNEIIEYITNAISKATSRGEFLGCYTLLESIIHDED